MRNFRLDDRVEDCLRVDGHKLLSDIRSVFADLEVDRISSRDLVEKLVEIETSPGSEWSHQGRPITKAKLARLLGKFGIAPDSIRFQDGIRKGFGLADFQDAFSRYLPDDIRNTGTTPVDASQIADLREVALPSELASGNVTNLRTNRLCSVVPLCEAENDPAAGKE